MEQKMKNVKNCQNCENYGHGSDFYCYPQHEIIATTFGNNVVACSMYTPKKGNFFGLDMSQCDAIANMRRE